MRQNQWKSLLLQPRGVSGGFSEPLSVTYVTYIRCQPTISPRLVGTPTVLRPASAQRPWPPALRMRWCTKGPAYQRYTRPGLPSEVICSPGMRLLTRSERSLPDPVNELLNPGVAGRETWRPRQTPGMTAKFDAVNCRPLALHPLKF